MPKGATSRPYNRKEKNAARQMKNRSRLAVKSLKSGTSSETVARKIYGTSGATKDFSTLEKRRTKAADRKIYNTLGKKNLSQSKHSTKRTQRKK